jgi:hypothetical protein
LAIEPQGAVTLPNGATRTKNSLVFGEV